MMYYRVISITHSRWVRWVRNTYLFQTINNHYHIWYVWITRDKKKISGIAEQVSGTPSKSWPNLIHDLLTRQQENPQVSPMYMLEVFTKPGIDSQAARNYIFEKSGMVAGVYDHGTHYVTNQKLTLECSKKYLILKMFRSCWWIYWWHWRYYFVSSQIFFWTHMSLSLLLVL